MTKTYKMDNWRLSKIEDELRKLNLDSAPTGTVRFEPKSLTDSDSKPRDESTEDICSKIIFRPAYRKTSRTKDVHKAAVRRFNEKYDSPNSVSKSDYDSEKMKNESSTTTMITTTATTTTTAAMTARSPKPEEFQSSPTFLPPNWIRSHENSRTGRTKPLDLNNGTTRREIQDNGIDAHATHDQKRTLDVDEQQQFVFRTLTIPAIPRQPESDQRIKDDGHYSRIGPPTAAKTFYSSFRGPKSPGANENVNLSRLESNHKIRAMPEKKTETLKPQTSNIHQHPAVDPAASDSGSPTIAIQDVLPRTRHDQSPVDTFPEPPHKLFHLEINTESPVRENKIQQENIHALSDSSPSGLSETKVYSKRDDLLLVNANVLSGDQRSSKSHSEDRVAGQSAVEQPPCEYISRETQEIRHLADSYNTCYPRYGTLKATRRHRNSPTSEEGDPKCEFMPPSGPGLSDEDRNQVEMFYRSHKSRVFAARCEANLYLGSARRHSSVHASRAVAARAMTESPSESENWLPLKRGVPVLVLDTGESHRQRRLHVILAERGSGFVLWRDTIDHLTGYGISPTVGFHTMHLSKDHTKLAGLYFADPIYAGDFYDYLNNLISDPDDPLLNLSSSSGTRKGRRKDRKSSSSSSTKRKEKNRKSIRREDISTPCCFVHVTKLDHCDVSTALDANMTSLDS